MCSPLFPPCSPSFVVPYVRHLPLTCSPPFPLRMGSPSFLSEFAIVLGSVHHRSWKCSPLFSDEFAIVLGCVRHGACPMFAIVRECVHHRSCRPFTIVCVCVRHRSRCTFAIVCRCVRACSRVLYDCSCLELCRHIIKATPVYGMCMGDIHQWRKVVLVCDLFLQTFGSDDVH